MEYGSFRKKFGKFHNFLRFRTLFSTNFRNMFYKKIREVRWHVVSVVLILNLCGETAYLVRFIEL